jgi:hypothetical protein
MVKVCHHRAAEVSFHVKVVDLWYRMYRYRIYEVRIMASRSFQQAVGMAAGKTKKKTVRMGREICISCSDDGGKRNWR